MQFVIQENFTAQPFIGSNGIPLNVAPKDFSKGQAIDATEQMNPARQVFWVSSDGYTLDMTKVSAAVNQTVAPLIGPIMNLQAVQGFQASPFIFNPSAPPLLPLQPKIFVTGQRLDAQQQYNILGQPFIVSGGYVVDMSKVQQVNYPQYYGQYPQQPPMGYYGPGNFTTSPRVTYRQNEQPMGDDAAPAPAKATVLPATGLSGLLSNKNNIIYIVIALLLIYLLFIKKSTAGAGN
jgi:hypothetical protein